MKNGFDADHFAGWEGDESRRRLDGERSVFCKAANNAVFELRRVR